jgi:AraC family transcriptional regulator of adaptative response/methylated-DNA-[protein]-cysteine methyltransferase
MAVQAVRTTGIFCRPGCPSAPNPENVVTLPGPRDALFAGYRPCRRCHPLAGPAAPAWARDAIAAVEAEPDAARQVWQVAVPAGTNAETLTRWMEHRNGLTFAEYLRARRLTSILRRAATARRAAPRGAGAALSLLDTPLGPMLAGATDAGICLLEFTDRPMLPTELRALERLRGTLVAGRHPHLDGLRRRLDAYFAGRQPSVDVPLDTPGSPFQRRVWEALRRIPAGTTVTYAELAGQVGRPAAARAVGRANGSNRVAVVIPCHRVVAAGGALGGYGGGLDRKRRLLDLEASRGTGSGRDPAHAGLPALSPA